MKKIGSRFQSTSISEFWSRKHSRFTCKHSYTIFSPSFRDPFLARHTKSYQSTDRVWDVRKGLLKDANPQGLCVCWRFLSKFRFTFKTARGLYTSKLLWIGKQKGDSSKIAELSAMKRCDMFLSWVGFNDAWKDEN